jgi:glycine cleavage system H protein
MPIPPKQTTYYKQVRFTTRLPNHYKYSPSHYWILEVSDGQFRVGFTKFAARMLGDFVEITYSVNNGDQVAVGDSIGSVEGFKAISEVYCVSNGVWLRGNTDLAQQPDLVDKDSYDRGWLYEMSGPVNDEWLSVDQYIALLDATIGKMLEHEQQAKDSSC